MLPGQILAHRGLWDAPDQKNSRAALLAALQRGFGLETDVRDHRGRLVISHDPPDDDALELERLLEDFRRLGADSTLALNIKADGLAEQLQRLVASYEIETYFVFDMSAPEMLHYCRMNMPCFSRRSEIESEIVGFDRCAGIWLDAFETDWYRAQTINELVSAGKRVAIVSPEIHRRDPRAVWAELRDADDAGESLYCCTDRPDDFRNWMS